METFSYVQLNAIKNAINEYYTESPIAFLPSRADFDEWLCSLLEDDQRLYGALGMMHCANLPSFRRYFFQQHGHELDAFLKRRLSVVDYQAWLDL